MRKHFILLLMTAVFLLTCFVSVGQVLTANHTTQRFDNFHSAYLKAGNSVWLTDGYNTDNKYTVFYINNIQKQLDSSTTWNNQQWGVDENTGKLFTENNFSEKPPEYFLDPYNHEFNSFINSNHSILKDPANTFIPGSVRGDLISMYAIFEYHRVFLCASCRSTGWPKTFKTGYNPVPAAFLKYIQDNAPVSKNHKIYFSYGTELLDPNYKPSRQQVNKIMKIVGYTPINWITKEFPGASHIELAWSTRLYISLMILLGK